MIFLEYRPNSTRCKYFEDLQNPSQFGYTRTHIIIKNMSFQTVPLNQQGKYFIKKIYFYFLSQLFHYLKFPLEIVSKLTTIINILFLNLMFSPTISSGISSWNRENKLLYLFGYTHKDNHDSYTLNMHFNILWFFENYSKSNTHVINQA